MLSRFTFSFNISTFFLSFRKFNKPTGNFKLKNITSLIPLVILMSYLRIPSLSLLLSPQESVEFI